MRSPPDERAAGGRAKESQSANFVIRSCLSVYKALDGTFVGPAAMAKRSPDSSVPFVGDRQRREAVAAGGSPRTPRRTKPARYWGREPGLVDRSEVDELMPPMRCALFRIRSLCLSPGHIIAEPGKGPPGRWKDRDSIESDEISISRVISLYRENAAACQSAAIPKL